MRSIDMNNEGDLGLQIYKVEDQYMISVGSLINNIKCLNLLRVDAEGNVIYKRQYSSLPYNWEPNAYTMCRVGDRSYIAGQIYDPQNNTQGFIMEFDDDTGDSLGMIIQGGPYQELVINLTPTFDGNLLMGAYRHFSDNRIWLQKRRPDLSLVWERFLGPSFSWQGLGKIVESVDGEIVFGRRVCLHPSGLCTKENLLITRTDSTGQEIWSIMHPEKADNTHPSMVAMDNGEVAVSWARDLWEELDSMIPYPPSVLWYSREGELVRRYDFASTVGRDIFNLKIASNGDIFGVGMGDRRAESMGLTGWLFRLSPQGELLWERYISDIRNSVKLQYFRDLHEEPDGSLVLVGSHNDTFPDHIPFVNNPNVWFVRLDSTGCFEPGCGSIQVITSAQEPLAMPSGSPELILFPNPAGASFSLLMEGYSQPVYPAQAKMWDMQGRLLEERTVGAPSEIWYCEDRPPGVYWIQIHTSAGQAGVAKLVKR
ncbi:MAG TPA: T9SS type A sorting domain-containing protein [Saprospiraceae bacterium]|nr:T9SS type A sorting domain-containing protein [Saprospiraceae bacterium]